MTGGPVIVAGGAGAVGALLVTALRTDGAEVLILDPTPPPDDDTALATDITAPVARAATALRAASTVVLAVPEPVALAAIPVLGGLLAPGTLLVETLSVKSTVPAVLHTHAPQVQAVGIPAEADGRVVADEAVDVQRERRDERLQTGFVKREQAAVEGRRQRPGPPSVVAVPAVVGAQAIVQHPEQQRDDRIGTGRLAGQDGGERGDGLPVLRTMDLGAAAGGERRHGL